MFSFIFVIYNQRTNTVNKIWHYIPEEIQKKINLIKQKYNNDAWGARGVMVIVAGCGHDDTSSNPGRAWLHFA